MLTTTNHAAVQLPAETLREMQDLYERGQYLQALRLGESFGPLRCWTGTPARILAGRLASNLGSMRLSFQLFARAWRGSPRDPEAGYFFGLGLLDRRGPLAAWKFLRARLEWAKAPAPLRADWLALHARLAGRVRDFDTAENRLRQAEEACADRPWIWIEWSSLLEFQDRPEEALEAARKGLALRPWYRPGVQAAAHVLHLLDRKEEALALLTEADDRLESGMVTLQLALLLVEMGRYADARRAYDRCIELLPLADRELTQFLTARRCEAAYLDGDNAAAAGLARQIENDPYHQQFAENLVHPPAGAKRHLLPVGFVRQHYRTCAPATLAALSRFWLMPADHLEIAEEICYDGTPAPNERRWAEEHGWAAREFSVTWDSAVALLERGVPFTLTFVEPTFAHLQACIGYDSLQKTLLIRDPSQPYFAHFFAEPFLQRYRSTGPRGMAMVPRARAELLDGVSLPDADRYDRLYEVHQALRVHARARAGELFEALKAEAPDHYLTWHARRVLAGYDADHTEALAATEGLLRLFPDDQPLQMAKLRCLRDLVRRDERLTLLKELCARPGFDPVFRLMYAQELSSDARQDRETERLLRRVIRQQPAIAQAYLTLANVRWGQRRFEEALHLYRWAACLEDKDEFLAQTYFNAARHLGKTESVLAMLEDRFRRFGARSPQPAITLFGALCLLEKRTEAFAILHKALEFRPDDGTLLLFAAQSHANHGEPDRAAELLTAAEGKAPRSLWLRTAAHLALLRGEHEAALGYWRAIAAAEPLALDAHRETAALLAETGRRDDALNHLRQVCERFPHHYPLHQLWIEWLRQEGPAAVEPVVRRLVEIHPADAWARRELATTLAELGRLDEAWPEAELGLRLDPGNPFSHALRGKLHWLSGRPAEAKEEFRQALRLSVDCEYALSELILNCENLAERRQAFAFIQGELERQVIFGGALLTFRELARHTLEPREVLELMRKAHEARPDLWHAWSGLINQLLESDSAAEALELARQATARFPLLPALWLDLARACQSAGDAEGEIDAIRKGLRINPAWGPASRQLAAACQRAGRMQEAREALEMAIRLAPLDYTNHSALAETLWQLGEKKAALECLKQALRLMPGFEAAWIRLAEWSARAGEPGAAVELARDLTQKRPLEARSWLMLARVLTGPEVLTERLEALNRALELNPRCADAYDLKADLLAGAGRFDEALAACAAPVWNGRPPLNLRGREAWVEARAGTVDKAMKKMEKILEEDPSYYWGWTQLAEWRRDHATPEEYRKAADTLVRLNPMDGIAHGFQGDARLRQGDRAGAKESFRRAVELFPDYRFGALALFDLQVEDREVDDAERTLALLRNQGDDEVIKGRAVELAARQGRRDEALRALKELCLVPGLSTPTLQEAIHALNQAGWQEPVDEVLSQVVREPQAAPEVAYLWVHGCAGRGDWYFKKLLPELVNRGEIGLRALYGYVQVLGEKKLASPLRECLRRYDGPLHSDTRCWGMVGFAFANLDDYEAAAQWLADYNQRPDVQAWMLLNLVIALRATGADEAAARVSRRALELPADVTTPFHRVWLALDEALVDSPSDKTRSEIDPAQLDPTHRFLLALVTELRRVQYALRPERGRAFAEARRRLRQAARDCAPLVQDRPAVLRAYRRAVRRLAREGGTPLASLWSLWRRLFPLLPKKVK